VAKLARDGAAARTAARVYVGNRLVDVREDVDVPVNRGKPWEA
jgi:hypothetical protein